MKQESIILAVIRHLAATKNKFNGEINYTTVNNYLSAMRLSKRRNNANRCLPILLQVYKLRNCTKAKAGRLLCILQLWHCCLPTCTDE